MNPIFAQIKRVLGNFYIMTAAIFLVWMFFFDTNDFITQYQMRDKLNDIKEEKKYYLDKIQEVKEDRKELLEQPELLEKFAREKYLMKKPTEQIFIINETEKIEE